MKGRHHHYIDKINLISLSRKWFKYENQPAQMARLLLLLLAVLVASPLTQAFYNKLQRIQYNKYIRINARVAKAEEGTEDGNVDKEDPKITIPFKGSHSHVQLLTPILPYQSYNVFNYLLIHCFLIHLLTTFISRNSWRKFTI